MHEVSLNVNGTDYGGWKSMRLARALDQLSGSFDLTVSELWPGEKIVREVAPGDKCAVTIDRETVITGHVDDVRVGYAAESHEVSVNGRDATGDLVDCSAVHKTGTWVTTKMERIVADLCAPFKIKVATEVDTGVAVDEKITQGEAAFEVIDRLAKKKAVLVMSDGKGGLVITRAGKGGRVGITLKRGENIKEASLELSWRERFSSYTVKGQGSTTDLVFNDASRLQASVADPMVKRHRPLLVVAEDLADADAVKRRALWEANVRAGKCAQITVKLQGWSHPGGVWRPNQVVHLIDPWLRTDADLLIKQVILSLDGSGSTTELMLVLPQAFDLVPMVKKPADAWDVLSRQQKDIEKLKREAEQKK